MDYKLTPEVIAKLRKIFEEPDIFDHLTDDEIAKLIGDLLEGEDRRWIKEYLPMCSICRHRVQLMMKVLQVAESCKPEDIPEIYYDIARRLLA